MLRVCFVCLGNICRSPTAHGIMEKLIREAGLEGDIMVDSAGTGAWHVGELPDARTRATAAAHGVSLDHRARQFTSMDFDRFDYVVAVDNTNAEVLRRLAPSSQATGKIHLLREFDAESPRAADVPDPYYGNGDGFEEVFSICDAGCRGLLTFLRDAHALGAHEAT